MGAYYLGKLGTSVGWAINIAASLMIANVLGFFTGEWKSASSSSRRVLYTGLGVLLLAMVLLAEGNSMAVVEEARVQSARTELGEECLCNPSLYAENENLGEMERPWIRR